jgi:L-glyceraldehyde 3-phosphate reductase
MLYQADEKRYDDSVMKYERCGRSGVLLPRLSLGFWHNFGSVDPYERSREITRYAFDHGVTHFDLANNYGPVYGSAEETMGRLMDDVPSVSRRVIHCHEGRLRHVAGSLW